MAVFKSPRDEMQFSTLGAQRGLGSLVTDWYYDATSNPNGQLWIDLSPRKDYRFRYCTKRGFLPQKIISTNH